MSLTERIFEAARKTFGKKVYAAWPQVIAEAEYALWHVWNDQFGPLTHSQLDYGVRVICRCLERGVDHPNPYGAYYRYLRSSYTHEDVRAEMQRLGAA